MKPLDEQKLHQLAMQFNPFPILQELQKQQMQPQPGLMGPPQGQPPAAVPGMAGIINPTGAVQ